MFGLLNRQLPLVEAVNASRSIDPVQDFGKVLYVLGGITLTLDEAAIYPAGFLVTLVAQDATAFTLTRAGGTIYVSSGAVAASQELGGAKGRTVELLSLDGVDFLLMGNGSSGGGVGWPLVVPPDLDPPTSNEGAIIGPSDDQLAIVSAAEETLYLAAGNTGGAFYSEPNYPDYQGGTVEIKGGQPKLNVADPPLSADKDGGPIRIQAGNSRGTGQSIIDFWTAPPGATGTTVRSKTKKAEIDGRGNVILNKTGSALATTATGGFTYLPTCAGTPTGVPDVLATGAAPMVIDTTNHKLYAYYGAAWHDLTGA